MRIIFFNIWHGHEWSKLQRFLDGQKEGTDIFAFAEVDPQVLEKLKESLVGFTCIYDKGIRVDYFDIVYEGRALFIKKNLVVNRSKKAATYHKRSNDAGGMLYADILLDNKPITVACIHGKARPGTKIDTPIRLKQSQIIIDTFRNNTNPVIIGGDFNLNPDTESVKMFEKSEFKNLIKDFSIKSTRNRLSWEQFASQPGYIKQYFADFCFVSKNVKVKSFEVPNIEASDHEPLILDFEI